MTYSPYKDGYGSKWPSSCIVSDLYNNISRLPRRQRAMDFGCGLGPHGLLLETCGFREVFYVDKDFAALESAREFLRNFPYSGSRFFLSDIFEISETSKFDVIIDRASLQHVSKDLLPKILSRIASILFATEYGGKSHGCLISEWVVSSSMSQVENFPEITYYNEIRTILDDKFKTISKVYRTSEWILDTDVSSHKVVNLVLTPLKQ